MWGNYINVFNSDNLGRDLDTNLRCTFSFHLKERHPDFFDFEIKIYTISISLCSPYSSVGKAVFIKIFD
jgi:hypothetical protein